MVERAWCGEAVDHVQITVAESAGIERRGRYYEEAGALRDMVQNHLLQVLAFVAMEPPDSLAPEDVRDRKAELLEAVRPFSEEDLVRGQYVAGVVEGHEVPGCASQNAGCSRARASRACRHTTWRSGSSPTRASRWSSGPRIRVRGWRSTPCRWTSPTGAHSGRGRPRPTSASCTTRWRAIRHSSCARTRSNERSWEIVAPVLDRSGTVHPYAAGTGGPSAADELIAPRAWQLG